MTSHHIITQKVAISLGIAEKPPGCGGFSNGVLCVGLCFVLFDDANAACSYHQEYAGKE
jgi:hypothetical protein